MKARGGTISFYILDSTGRTVEDRVAMARATARIISIRSGCSCNPCAGETALRISLETMTAFAPGNVNHLASVDDFWRHLEGNCGPIRVSLGIVSNFTDVWYFVEFVRTFVDSINLATSELPPRTSCSARQTKVVQRVFD
ncbi:hypothetical protein M427DRAFT_438941 [Gonapodya prolifera JEL478]|uniref:PLP-dependent transferase n=1 Tax=Gonapodya prolifera (strain JEL478) TaxID=1344416 RepID=A0A139A429_GONPJ|nr:hypothetical protein M427DRAFT_438941 [Gonapodya prolifera JEL478]|eukprot:KXS11348.1 hypothetical protein M427DRAFT_438941 [Gonapodya prolifera JEL478]